MGPGNKFNTYTDIPEILDLKLATCTYYKYM